jgi:hypothetical protein
VSTSLGRKSYWSTLIDQKVNNKSLVGKISILLSCRFVIMMEFKTVPGTYRVYQYHMYTVEKSSSIVLISWSFNSSTSDKRCRYSEINDSENIAF